MKRLAKRIIPRRYHTVVSYILITVRYYGLRFKCPCCNGHFRKLLLYGADRKCPKCGSLKRHRLLCDYLEKRTDFFTAHKKVLNISPLPFFQKKFKNLKNLDYISADISSPMVMIRIDITNIATPDNQFDCIICYHVLEHIPDDKKAMKELFRVLKPGGWAILQSPVCYNLDKTFEDPNIVSPEKKRRVFGQEDHVRRYGRDYKDRLQRAGFTVRLDNYVKELEDDKIKKYDLPKNEIIYFCTKPKPHNSG
jgi:SAM-dependent methyltransferase